MTYADATLDAFTRATAAKESVPGGGAVAAVILAHAASLASMVVAFSRGKRTLADHEPMLEEMEGHLETIRASALDLADRDAAAFEELLPLFQLKSDDPQRRAALPAAATAAIEPALAVLALGEDVAKCCETLVGRSSLMLKSDLVIASRLAAAATDAAACNVRINLPLLAESGESTAAIDALNETIASAVANAVLHADTIAATCRE